MPNLRDYHIFISHSWKYADQYKRVKEFLDNTNCFKYTDYSVPTDNPLDFDTNKELRNQISNRIANSSCVIILSGMYVPYSKWIDFEIDTARAMNKPIIGVMPWGQERIPAKVFDNADTMVGWNANSVVSAVREYSI